MMFGLRGLGYRVLNPPTIVCALLQRLAVDQQAADARLADLEGQIRQVRIVD